MGFDSQVNDRKAELFEMLSNPEHREKNISEYKLNLKSKLGNLSELNNRDNYKLLGSGNYIKQSLTNLKKTFKL